MNSKPGENGKLTRESENGEKMITNQDQFGNINSLTVYVKVENMQSVGINKILLLWQDKEAFTQIELSNSEATQIAQELLKAVDLVTKGK